MMALFAKRRSRNSSNTFIQIYHYVMQPLKIVQKFLMAWRFYKNFLQTKLYLWRFQTTSKQKLSMEHRVSFFATDYYLNRSVKAMERERGSTYGTIRIKVLGKEQVTPKQWKKFMRYADSKTYSIIFLLRDWFTNERNISVLEGKEMFMTIRDQAYCISSNEGILSCSPLRLVELKDSNQLGL